MRERLCPWENERYHDDNTSPDIAGEKRTGGRKRYALKLAALMSRKGERDAAAALRACGPNNRCGLSICPNCTTAQKRWLATEARQTFTNADSLYLVTILHSSEKLLRSSLGDFETRVADCHQELSDGLTSCGLAMLPILGGFDVSLNHYTGDQDRDIWLPHWHLITADVNQEMLGLMLRRSFPPLKPWVVKPVVVKRVTRTPDLARNYLFKTGFEEKWIHVQGENANTTKVKVIRETNPQFYKLMMMLNSISLNDRIFMQNISIEK